MKNVKASANFPINLWVQGICEDTEVIWLSESHVEMVVREGLELAEERMVALLLRNFLSLPMRVEMQMGRHVVLQFDQRPHATVLDVLKQDVIELALVTAELGEAQDSPIPKIFCDFEARDEEVARLDKGEDCDPSEEAA